MSAPTRYSDSRPQRKETMSSFKDISNLFPEDKDRLDAEFERVDVVDHDLESQIDQYFEVLQVEDAGHDEKCLVTFFEAHNRLRINPSLVD